MTSLFDAQQSERPSWVNVLVDYGGSPEIYTYGLPPHLLTVEAGDILTVPFGSQQVGAIALAVLTELPLALSPDQVRMVEGVVEKRFFSATYWALLQRVADYYQTPLVQVLRAALPPGLLAIAASLAALPRSHPPQVDEHLAPAVASLLNTLRRSTRGDYTWQYLKRHNISYRTIQQLIQLGWAESYLAPPQAPQPQQRQAVLLTTITLGRTENLTARQAEILAILKRHGGDLWLSEALQLCKTTSATLKRMADQGYVTLELRERLRAETGPALVADTPKDLTPDQAQVLAAINQCRGVHQILLHGVTGSGKTEIYLQAIATPPRRWAIGPGVGARNWPYPQLTDRFRRRFGAQVCVYHSGLGDGERYDTWRQCLQPGHPLVIVGTRSAIFLPLRNLGLIILDEEHDSSYKQDVTPCYHARTVARWRATLENCPLILGSATPSLETWVECHPSTQNVSSGDASPGHGQSEGLTKFNIQNSALPTHHPSTHHPYTPPAIYLSLPERVQARPLPQVEVIDMREELQRGNRSILSSRLQRALTEMKQQGNQGLLFIHRRGHSSFVSCRSCGFVIMCPHCDVSLSYHQPHAHSATTTLRCHYCGYSQGHPRHCPDCGSPYLKHFGSGTQRVVNALAETFPDLSCIRFDSDTTRNKGSHRALLTRFAEGEADLLVGTQMLTKGIDLPQVTLVGIIAADGLLYMNDYWASERALQMLIQVAGRAGRGDQPGEVLLQTYTPDHPVIEAVTQHAYEPFITEEWEQRQLLQYPPPVGWCC